MRSRGGFPDLFSEPGGNQASLPSQGEKGRRAGLLPIRPDSDLRSHWRRSRYPAAEDQMMATPAGRRVKEALVASLILIAACGGNGPLNIRAENCSPWSAPDGVNGYQHCLYTAGSGNRY